MRQVIENRILELLRAACAQDGDAAAVSLEAKLGNLAVDSMKLVEIVFELERTLGFEADEGKLAGLVTVRDIADMVEAAVVAPAS